MSITGRRPRVALIGISGYGQIHLQLARECRDRGELDLIAVTVINQAEEAANVAELRSKGAAIYGDYVEMLRRHAGEIDLCLIPTGIHWHARMTIAALEAGANVLVEKPLCSSLAEVEAIKAAEKKSGRFVAVGFQDYYCPGTLWLKSKLLSKAIGDIKSVAFLGLWPRPRTYFTRNNWAGRLSVDQMPVLDSPMNNAFAHFVMLSLFFAGSSISSAAEAQLVQAELYRAHDIESFDTAVSTFRTKDGVTLWFGVSHACPTNLDPEIVITGTKGTACWRYESEAWLKDANGTQHRVLMDISSARRAMMAAALSRLQNPTVPVCSTVMAACHTAVIDALHRNLTIQTIPAETIAWSENGAKNGLVPVVPELEPALRRAFATQSTLSVAGFQLRQPSVRC